MSAIAQLQLKQEGLTERLPTEQQLRDAQRMEAIGRLVGGVAHDFNNLLTGMVLCSELILSGLGKNSPLRRYAEEIRNAGEQGTGLIEQLMAVARARAIEPRLLCLNDVISDVRILLIRLIGENIAFTAELADDLGLVRMDATQIQQIILNLVLNARDAMPDGGCIVIKTRNWDGASSNGDPLHQSWIEFTVHDNGCGMTTETQSRLFEPFFTKKPGHGNGLGLATVHRIVTQEGGKIAVESAPAKGTRIVVHLPRAEAQPIIFNVPSTAQFLNKPIAESKKRKSGRGKSV
jgi:two-component system, cell cycle sensor histidine kinase and response regulator CckA